MRRTCSTLLLVCAALTGGCGERAITPGPTGARDATLDGPATRDGLPRHDVRPWTDARRPPDRGRDTGGALACARPPCHDYVLSRLLLPTDSASVQRYAFFWPGSTAGRNALGNILVLLASQGELGLQGAMDRGTYSGANLVLLRVSAPSLVTSTGTQGQAWLGEPRTCCTTPAVLPTCKSQAMAACFGGSTTFKRAAGGPADLLFAGHIAGGAMVLGPGKMTLDLPFDCGTLSVTLRSATLKGSISAGAITNGVLNGVVSRRDLDNVVVPGVATLLDKAYRDPSTDGKKRKMLAQLFDTNQDGTITLQEFRDNPLIKTFLAGDVDIDGDGQKELSMGIGFEAVKAVIGR